MIVHLVRHPPVARIWANRCYGRSDPGLSIAGRRMITPLVEQCIALNPDVIIHSDMKRSRAVAGPLAARLDIASVAAPLWRERDFGTWEGMTWQRIYRATGNAMDGMVQSPDTFAPGGGETTSMLIARVEQALLTLPQVKSCIVISHGGPIACAVLIQRKLAVAALAAHIPKLGEIVHLSR